MFLKQHLTFQKRKFIYLVVNLLGIKLELTNMLKLFSPWWNWN